MTGEDLKLSGTRADFDTSPGASGRPIVTMEFTDSGADKFEEITRDEWIRGKLRQQPQHFAIVLDREIKTFPQIDFTDSSLSERNRRRTRADPGPRLVPGGEGHRARPPDRRAAGQVRDARPHRHLRDARQGLAERGVEARRSPGSSSSRSSCSSSTASSVSSRSSGLAIYAAFLYATILIFNVTLTLPGFAGLVLTFGVAADANIVIFERIKEEVRAGRSVRAAIAQGYRKGFATIVDANVVTAITAMVLFAVATASVRGFALMLLIGTALSMLTAVARDARDPRRARRLRLVRQPALHGRDRRRASRAGCAGTTSAGAGSGSRSPARVVALSVARDRRQRPQPRDRLQGRHADHVPHARADVARAGAQARRPAIGQAGRRHPGPRRVDGRQVHELPDPHRVADDRRAERAPAGARGRRRGDVVRRQERLRELRAPDREQRAASRSS